MTATTLSGRVAANIRAELARKSFTQEQLATHLGVSRSSLNQRLGGRTALDLDEIEKIAKALGIEPARLLSTDD